MFRRANDIPPNFGPVDARVQLLVHQPHEHNVVASDQIQPMARLGAWFRVVRRPDDALDGVAQDQVGDLVAGEEVAGEGSAVDGDYKNTLCVRCG